MDQPWDIIVSHAPLRNHESFITIYYSFITIYDLSVILLPRVVYANNVAPHVPRGKPVSESELRDKSKTSNANIGQDQAGERDVLATATEQRQNGLTI
jgi:hypothetical protein